jgi:mercuric reductase
MRDCDLLIVGGGAAAFAAVTRAHDLNAQVLMINDGLPLGGTCVNVGCIPSKFLLEALKRYRLATHGADHWLQSSASLDYAKLVQAKDALVGALRQRNYTEVLKALGNVTLVEGRARFVGPHEVEVEGTGERFRSDKIIIATGARTYVPPVPGLDEVSYWTNREALAARELPKSLVIWGAGPLATEFAQIFARAGSRVTVLARGPRILRREEPEVSEELRRHLEAEGIEIFTQVRIEGLEERGDRVRVHARVGSEKEPKVLQLQAEALLVATGIRPNTDHMGLEEIGVHLDERGFIITDERQETSVPGVYAAGDVTGKKPLETVAARQGFNAAHNALTGESRTIDYDLVPHAVFTDPQVASVGWTEERELEELGRCWCQTLPLSEVPKAHAAGDTRGLVKLVVHPETRKILGAHAVAASAAEIIHVPLLAMRAGLTIDDLIETVHVFPTYSEAWKLCAQSFERDLKTMSCCVV